MCSVLEQCQLSAGDIQRLQIAFGKSGLSEFEISNHQIMVPRDQRTRYLKILGDLDFLPEQLASDTGESPNLNPFLSRTQQKMLARIQKKKLVREMIERLPYVQQAGLNRLRPTIELDFNPLTNCSHLGQT